mgnify:CR=1 FL=1
MQTYLSSNAPTPREYQKNIANSVLTRGSSLVVLPTGMGKTLLALLVADKILQTSSVLFLAPTRPLVEQHLKTSKNLLSLAENDIVMVSGQTYTKERQKIYQSKPKFLLSTPQTIANDLEKKRLDWYFGLVIFDEAHRAVGKYAYTKVAEVAKEHNSIILGLTASPGGQKKKIEQILQSLGISNVEIRTSKDKDVLPYIKPLEINWIKVPLSNELIALKNLLTKMIEKYSKELGAMGIAIPFKSKKKLLELKEKLLEIKAGYKYHALSLYYTVFSLVHLLELIESEGINTAKKFVQKLRKRKSSKALSRIFKDELFIQFEKILEQAKEHPKIEKLIQIIKSRPANEKFIIFSQYRDQVVFIAEQLSDQGLLARPFMGKKEGFSQKQQIQLINDFREEKFNILVATSIGEEGLDIPTVDNVIFYEPVPSEIRAIQRRGRAGRAKLGRLFGLISEGTRDEAFFWSALRKEQKMKKIVSELASKNSSFKHNTITNTILQNPPPESKKTKKSSQSKLTDFFS